jgi:hypothetical protein
MMAPGPAPGLLAASEKIDKYHTEGDKTKFVGAPMMRQMTASECFCLSKLEIKITKDADGEEIADFESMESIVCMPCCGVSAPLLLLLLLSNFAAYMCCPAPPAAASENDAREMLWRAHRAQGRRHEEPHSYQVHLLPCRVLCQLR